jgi:Tfp pilus assembly protein PilN
MGMSVQVRRLRREIAQVEQERNQYQASVKQIEQLQAEQKALQPRLEVLRQAHGRNHAWRALLTEVRTLLPPGLWLTRLAAEPPSKEEKEKEKEGSQQSLVVSFEGMAFTYEEIGLFAQRLVRSEYFDEVQVGNCREVLLERQYVTAFQLRAPLVKDMAAPVPGGSLPPTDPTASQGGGGPALVPGGSLPPGMSPSPESGGGAGGQTPGPAAPTGNVKGI